MRLTYGIVVCMCAVLVGCGSTPDQQLPTVVQIEATEPIDLGTPEPVDLGTPEPEDGTPELDDSTPETDDSTPVIQSNDGVTISIDEELIGDIPPNATEDNAYFITVTSLAQTFAEDDEPERYILDASLANQAGATVTVEASHLAIVDEAGVRYEPVDMPENIRPPLVGAELDEGDTLRGFAQFILPDDAVISHVEWCIGGDCESVVGAAVQRREDSE